MFKCKECGLEYEIKPDFCDCGNDEFIEVAGSYSPKTPSEDYSGQKTTFNEQYPEFGRMKKFFDPISTGVFLICIIVGLIVLFFVANPVDEPENNAVQNKPAETQNLNIPTIDSLWDNSTVGIVNNEKVIARTQQMPQPVQAQVPQPQENSLLSRIEATINGPNQIEPVKLQQTSQQVKVQSVPQQKTVSQPQKQAQQSAPQQKPQPQQNAAAKFMQNLGFSAPKQQPQPQTQNTQKPIIPSKTQAIATQPSGQTKPVQTTQKTQQTQTPVQQTKPSTTAQTQQNSQPTATKAASVKQTQVPMTTSLRPKATVDTQALQKELSNYKVGLRNTIGKKIDFANVVGDGDCTVSFKIASNGKITNRAFSKQSSNITLNDAVYSAVMATPNYNPPPSGYNNETMNLRIRFYNGNFDISLN